MQEDYNSSHTGQQIDNAVDNVITANSNGGIQSKNIVDSGGYFSTDTVEGALQALGAAKLNPTTKTSAMTQAVGKDDNGRLWTEPTGGGEGTNDHSQLTNRSEANQHPISAITNLQSILDGKQPTISDLATIRSNASAGAAKISCTDPQVGSYGYTKNTGTYSKPTGGIPKTDLSASIQSSLDKAETAIQSLDGYATENYVNNHHDTTKQDVLIESGAEVGQVLSVSSVDADGKPLSWATDTVARKAIFNDSTTFQSVYEAYQSGKICFFSGDIDYGVGTNRYTTNTMLPCVNVQKVTITDPEIHIAIFRDVVTLTHYVDQTKKVKVFVEITWDESTSDWVRSIMPLQSQIIEDVGNYFTTDTVDGALQEIGEKLDTDEAIFTFESSPTDVVTEFNAGKRCYFRDTVTYGGMLDGAKGEVKLLCTTASSTSIYGYPIVEFDGIASMNGVVADSTDICAKVHVAWNGTTNKWDVTFKLLQWRNILDSGNYYTTDTVEGALQEIGSTLSGVESALHTINTTLGGAL